MRVPGLFISVHFLAVPRKVAVSGQSQCFGQEWNSEFCFTPGSAVNLFLVEAELEMEAPLHACVAVLFCKVRIMYILQHKQFSATYFCA